MSNPYAAPRPDGNGPPQQPPPTARIRHLRAVHPQDEPAGNGWDDAVTREYSLQDGGRPLASHNVAPQVADLAPGPRPPVGEPAGPGGGHAEHADEQSPTAGRHHADRRAEGIRSAVPGGVVPSGSGTDRPAQRMASNAADPVASYWSRFPAERPPPSSDLSATLPYRRDTELNDSERWARVHLGISIVGRLTVLSENHALEAWARSYRKPISPTMVVLLFTVPGSPTPLRADVRGWRESPKVADPAAVLMQLAWQVHEGWMEPPFDVRQALINVPDPLWTPEDYQRRPEFVGVALSTLDTEYGAWKHMLRHAETGADCPGEVLVQLADGGRIRLLRHGAFEYYRIDRDSSVSLRFPNGSAIKWRLVEELNEIPVGHPHVYTWHFLAELTRMINWGWRP